jgi:anti-anti-sigma regulatory factor
MRLSLYLLQMEECLLVTIQVDRHDQLALTLQDELIARTVETRARGVLIDISGLEIVDAFIGRMLNNIAAMAHARDTETVVLGMQPAAVHLAPGRHLESRYPCSQHPAGRTTTVQTLHGAELRRVIQQVLQAGGGLP